MREAPRVFSAIICLTKILIRWRSFVAKLSKLLLVSTLLWWPAHAATADAGRAERLSRQLINNKFAYVCAQGDSRSLEDSINQLFVELSDRLPGLRLAMVPDPVGPISGLDESDRCVIIKRE